MPIEVFLNFPWPFQNRTNDTQLREVYSWPCTSLLESPSLCNHPTVTWPRTSFLTSHACSLINKTTSGSNDTVTFVVSVHPSVPLSSLASEQKLVPSACRHTFTSAITGTSMKATLVPACYTLTLLKRVGCVKLVWVARACRQLERTHSVFSWYFMQTSHCVKRFRNGDFWWHFHFLPDYGKQRVVSEIKPTCFVLLSKISPCANCCYCTFIEGSCLLAFSSVERGVKLIPSFMFFKIFVI